MKHLLSSITFLLLSTIAFGQVPNTFSSGETISSSKINANFAYLADAVKDGNVTAMMICTKAGKLNEKINGSWNWSTKFVYVECHSTDDQVFEDNIPGQIEIVDLKGTSVEKPFITLENIFANKWIPYQTTIHTFGTNTLLELYMFYKVSSD